jgi:hypothetical protein
MFPVYSGAFRDRFLTVSSTQFRDYKTFHASNGVKKVEICLKQKAEMMYPGVLENALFELVRQAVRA